MKKLYITAVVAFMGLFLMSFSTVNENEVTYNVVDDEELAYIAEVGEFTAYESKKYTSEKNLWKKRYKTWNEIMPGDDAATIEAIIERN